MTVECLINWKKVFYFNKETHPQSEIIFQMFDGDDKPLSVAIVIAITLVSNKRIHTLIFFKKSVHPSSLYLFNTLRLSIFRYMQHLKSRFRPI